MSRCWKAVAAGFETHLKTVYGAQFVTLNRVVDAGVAGKLFLDALLPQSARNKASRANVQKAKEVLHLSPFLHGKRQTPIRLDNTPRSWQANVSVAKTRVRKCAKMARSAATKSG